MLTNTQIRNYCKKVWDIATADGHITWAPDDSQFISAFRNYMKAIAKANGWEILDYKSHPYCEFTCFFKKGDRYIYVASGDYRDWSYAFVGANRILFRDARSDKDYRGGVNNYCNLEEIEAKVNERFNKEPWYGGW